jgi:hypothetical protein
MKGYPKLMCFCVCLFVCPSVVDDTWLSVCLFVRLWWMTLGCAGVRSNESRWVPVPAPHLASAPTLDPVTHPAPPIGVYSACGDSLDPPPLLRSPQPCKPPGAPTSSILLHRMYRVSL